MPPVVDPTNLYSETAAGKLSPAVQGALPRVYVPNLRSQRRLRDRSGDAARSSTRFKVGRNPQHVVPSWDLQDAVGRQQRRGPHRRQPDADRSAHRQARQADRRSTIPYNMYFTPDGKSAIVVAEALQAARLPRSADDGAAVLDRRRRDCGGINHADFSIDGRYAIFTCEFDGAVAKIDLVEPQGASAPDLTVLAAMSCPAAALEEEGPAHPTSRSGQEPRADGEICTSRKGMPQDIRISPDGKTLLRRRHAWPTACSWSTATSFKQIGFIPTGIGTHGLYPSRDGKKLYVANRGSQQDPRHARTARAACR